jgi:hypothetical protein
MAKSARASSRKKNNQRKAANIFGPAESVRAERLSAKLLELAKQPKPESSDVAMKTDDGMSLVAITYGLRSHCLERLSPAFLNLANYSQQTLLKMCSKTKARLIIMVCIPRLLVAIRSQANSCPQPWK